MWLWHQDGRQFDLAEAIHIARAIQLRGQFADAFRPGQGPTAHLMPLSPLIAGGIFHLFGFQTLVSNAILTFWSMGLIFAAFIIQQKTFECLGLPRYASLAALATLSLVPLNFWLETVWFRVWEGGLAVALGSSLLYLLRPQLIKSTIR